MSIILWREKVINGAVSEKGVHGRRLKIVMGQSDRAERVVANDTVT